MAQGTTIAEMLADLAASKAAIVAALTAKGVTVPEGAKFEDLAALVAQVEGGSGGGTDVSAYLPAWEADRHTTKQLVIPEGVTKIGNYAFSSCFSLTSLVIPEGVTSIGVNAFSGCIALTSLVIPEGVTSIGDRAFSDCYSLTSLVIPEGVTSIGVSAFSDCNALTSLVIPEGVTSIGDYAFDSCPETCDIQFAKTMAEVSAMARYPWGISSGAVIHCTDGDLTVS